MANNFQITISAVDKTTEVVRKINAQVDKMMAPFDRLSKSVNNLGKEVGTNRLAKGLGNVATSASAAGDKIRGIVAPLMAVIGIGSIAGVTALALGLGRVQVALQNQATSIGMSTQELQKWQGAAKLASLSADDMNGALSSVGEKLDNAFRTPETVRDMNAIGLQMHRLKNGSIDTAQAILDIASAMERQGNVETKKRIADAFGVSAIFPLLVQGRAAVDKFYKESERTTKIFSPEEIEQGKRYQQQVQLVERSFDSLKNSLGVAVLPAFERVIGAVDRLVGKYGDVIGSKVAEYAEKIANWIDKTDWGKVADDVGKMVDNLGGVKTIAIALAAITFAGPIAGLLSMVIHATKLAALLTPIIANPVVLAAAGLFYSKGLNAGEDEELARRRGGLPGQTAAPAVSPLTKPITIDQRKALVLQRVRADGYSDAQAAGILGSLLQENSSLDPKLVNHVGAAGIAQWLSPSRKKDFEGQYGKRVQDGDLDEQINFMLWELRNSEKRSGNLLRKAKTPESAAEIHTWEYERPNVAEAMVDKRKANAAGIYAAMNSAGSAPIAAAPAAAGVAGTASAVAGNQSGAGAGPGGTVQVNVKFDNAPKGTTATAKSSGPVAVALKNDELSKAAL